MRKCTMCQNHDSCSEQRRRECRVRDYLFFRPTFVGRCDNCGAPLYADSVRYEATIGRQTLELEDVATVIQSFYLCNKGDEATTDLLLTVGAELLDISPDKMLEMITEGF